MTYVSSFFCCDSHTHDIWDYQKYFSGQNFWENIFVINHQTLNNLASIAYVVTMETKNVVLISEYDGCGKTSFLRYCDYVIHYSEPGNNPIRGFNGLDKIDDIISFCSQFMKIDFDKNVHDEIENGLNKILKGDSVYFDINNPGNGSGNRPVSEIFISSFRKKIVDLLLDNPTKLTDLYDFYCSCSDIFNDISLNNSDCAMLNSFFRVLLSPKKCGANGPKECTYEERIIEIIEFNFDAMNLFHLLWIFIITLLFFEENEKNIFIIIDNNDEIMSDSDDKNIPKWFWSFIETAENYVEKMQDTLQSENEEVFFKWKSQWINNYKKCIFIVSMHENANDYIDSSIERFVKDKSCFVGNCTSDLNEIVRRKYNYYNNNKEFLSNTLSGYTHIIEGLYNLTELPGISIEIWDWFNKNYYKSMKLLSRIINDSLINNAKELSNNGYESGARGIIYHALLTRDSISLGKHNGEVPYFERLCLIRIILTILYNRGKEPDNSTQYKSISLVELLNEIDVFIPLLSTSFDARELLKYLYKMETSKGKVYILNTRFITVDICKALDDKEYDNDTNVHLTKAGELFLLYGCNHFELFNNLFNTNKSKTALYNDDFKKNNGNYKFELSIKCVYDKVKNYCEISNKINQCIMRNNDNKSLSDLLTSDYNFMHIYKEYNENEVFEFTKHQLFRYSEERLIISQFEYIKAFKSYFEKNVAETNRIAKEEEIRIIDLLNGYLKKYLELLKYNSKDFYSTESKTLYNKEIALIR